jgi:hypothetical protein
MYKSGAVKHHEVGETGGRQVPEISIRRPQARSDGQYFEERVASEIAEDPRLWGIWATNGEARQCEWEVQSPDPIQTCSIPRNGKFQHGNWVL